MHSFARCALLVLALAAGAGAVARAGAAPTPAYPETEPGRHARDYFVAFNGDESAMRTFILTHIAAEDLAVRSAEARLDVWREMRQQFGRLTPLRVSASGKDFVEVAARAENGGGARIRLLCRPEPPHTLMALRVEGDDDVEDTGPGPGPEPAPPVGPPPTDAEIVAALAAEVDSLTRAGAFSGAVLLDKNGTTLLAKATGMASRETRRPNTVETRFDLGSINKAFTHTAILQLEEQGKLIRDDTIDRYLPDYPKPLARRITIRMLIEHRGGVPDVLHRAELERDPGRVRTVADWYRLIRDEPLEFDPGTKQQYSNGGYVLLGAIIERVSGKDYYRYVRDHVYGPAGMTASESDRLEDRGERDATPYTRRSERGTQGAASGSGTLHANPKRLGRGSPAGGGYSTVGDLVRFARAMRQGTLVRGERRLMTDSTGFGIAGGSPGVNGLLEVQGPYTLAVLANQDPPAAERFARTIGRMLARATGAGGARRVRVGGGGPH